MRSGSRCLAVAQVAGNRALALRTPVADGPGTMRPFLLLAFLLIPTLTACADDDAEPAGSPDAGDGDGELDAGGGDCAVRPGAGEADPELGICAGEGWCFANPLPQPNLVTSLWARSPDQVWGAAGRAFHWNGDAWSGLPGDPRLVDRVIGTGPDDLWFGGSILAHFKDGQLTSYPAAVPPDMGVFAMFRLADDQIWAVGTTGLALRWNGETWLDKSMPSGADFASVWGRAPNDVWAIAAGTPATPGTRMHWNGTAWQAVDAGAPCTFMQVWGEGPERGWGRCRSGELQHWNGADWVEIADPAPGDSIEVAGSADSAFAADGTGRVMHWDGSRWTTLLEGSLAADRIGFWSMTQMEGGDVLIGGDYGAIAHCSPSACSWLAGGPSTARFSMKAVWVAGPGDAWAVGDGIAHFDGRTWLPVDAPLQGRLYAVGGTSPTDVWAVGDSVVHYDGCSWSAAETGTSLPLGAIWAGAPDDVWAVGGELTDGVAVHFDGTSWTAHQMPVEMSGVWGAGKDAVWAVGMDGTIMRWDGEAWGPEGAWGGDTMAWFEAVWGTGPDDVWLVGAKDYKGFIAHRDASGWSAAPRRQQPDWFLFALGGSGSGDLWAAGNFGRVMHWDGEEWSQQHDLVIQGALEGIAVGPGGSWLVGNWGVILHHP